jgi:hypothetical protein
MDSILFFLDPDGMGRKDSIGQAGLTGFTGFFSPVARSPSAEGRSILEIWCQILISD